MNFTEECFCFGTDGALVGVLTRPVTAEPASDAAVIFFNAGLVHRVGPSRLYVELARELAALGWTCLRFDHAGIGDSPARGEQLPAEKAAVFEAIEALDALARHTGCSRFVLAGMCAGTPTALRAAVIERRVEALVLLNSVLGDRASADEQALQEMTGAFMCRPGHPLAKKREVTFAMLRRYPIASTPLSDEVARILMERFGPQGHPNELVNLRSEEISSLLDVVRSSDAVVLTIRAAAPDLTELPMSPPLNAKARFGLVTIAARSEAPLMDRVRSLMQRTLKDADPKMPSKSRKALR